MRFWIDPPSGWQHGFPKIYDDEKDPPMSEWLSKQGLPKHLIDFGHYRMWKVEEK